MARKKLTPEERLSELEQRVSDELLEVLKQLDPIDPAQAVGQNIADCVGNLGQDFSAEDILAPVPPPTNPRQLGPESVGLAIGVGGAVLLNAVGGAINALGNLGRRRTD